MTQEAPPVDPSSFADFVARHQSVVCAVAYSALCDRPLSEDVAQEAFLIAWQRLPSLREPPQMPAWLCGIARRVAANVRRKRRWEVTSMDPIEQATPAGEGPLEQLLSREDQRRCDEALQRLDEKYREPLVLYYRGEQSLAEVASALGLSEDAAKQRLSRGRKALEAELTQVERSLRGSRPGAVFTAAVVAAYLARGGVASAAGSSFVAGVAMKTAIAAVLVVAALGGGALWHARGRATMAVAPTVSSAPARPAVPSKTRPFASVPSPSTPRATVASPSIVAPRLAQPLDIDLKQLRFDEALRLLSEVSEVPIRVHGDLAADVNLFVHGASALEAIDDVLRQAGARRTEVPALRVVTGRGERLPFDGEAVSITVEGAPLADVAAALEGPLGRPIAIPAALKKTPVSLRAENLPAARALERVLDGAGLAALPSIAFEVSPDEP